ncbi:MAG: hypothetical protein MUF50_01080 [Planctomycetes bacterium]|jgi:CxxC-x17-CxxC domain-containing protein|nr:hypothetical protein [Planctomycetota bacterium]
MKKFNQGGGFGGGRKSGGFGGKSFGGGGFKSGRGFDRGSERRERPMMHEAICSECGKHCEVPFKPTGDRPVLCSICFGGKNGNEVRRPENRFEKSNDRFSDRKFSKPNFDDKKVFSDVKVNNNCDSVKEQLVVLNEKMGKILNVLESLVSSRNVEKPEIKKPEIKKLEIEKPKVGKVKIEKPKAEKIKIENPKKAKKK